MGWAYKVYSMGSLTRFLVQNYHVEFPQETKNPPIQKNTNTKTATIHINHDCPCSAGVCIRKPNVFRLKFAGEILSASSGQERKIGLHGIALTSQAKATRWKSFRSQDVWQQRLESACLQESRLSNATLLSYPAGIANFIWSDARKQPHMTDRQMVWSLGIDREDDGLSAISSAWIW